jgi:hypothetical protein
MKFTRRPKIGEVKYLAFLEHDGRHYLLHKVKMKYAGKKYFGASLMEVIIDQSEHGFDSASDQGQYFNFCFLETEEDAKRLLLIGALDGRDVQVFFREKPDLEELGVKEEWE